MIQSRVLMNEKKISLRSFPNSQTSVKNKIKVNM